MKQNMAMFRPQTLGEEIANAISHGAGIFFGITAMALLLVKSQGSIEITAAALYGTFMTLLYLSSCLYHALSHTKAKGVFRIFDHCSIFLLILGSYLPISLVLIGGERGWVLFGINTACAAIGILLNAIDLNRWDRVCQALYLLMGWSVLIAAGPVVRTAPWPGLILLVGGGLVYTVGTLFYRNGSRRYLYHFIWHLFVLAGSILHFFFFYYYCY